MLFAVQALEMVLNALCFVAEQLQSEKCVVTLYNHLCLLLRFTKNNNNKTPLLPTSELCLLESFPGRGRATS